MSSEPASLCHCGGGSQGPLVHAFGLGGYRYVNSESLGGGVLFTVEPDLKSGVVVFVGDGKGADALLPFWKRLRASHAKIEAVATDRSPAYIDAVTTHLPKTALVFDRFHVMKLYNEKLSQKPLAAPATVSVPFESQ